MASEYIGAVGGRFVTFSINGILSDVYMGDRAAQLVLLDRVLIAKCATSNATKRAEVFQVDESRFRCSIFEEMRWPMYSCPCDGDLALLREIAEKDGGRHLSNAFAETMPASTQCTKRFHFAGKDHFVTYISAASGNRMDNTALLVDSLDFWHFESYENFLPTTSDFPVYLPLGALSKDDWEQFNAVFAEMPQFIRLSMNHPHNSSGEPHELVVSISICSLDSVWPTLQPVRGPL